MNEIQEILTQSQKTEHYEDEIELIDILRVIWKWKYFILSGVVVCGLIAAIISFNMTKIYSIDMVLRPGILKVGDQGNNVYIDSPQHMKTLIESGKFNDDILKYLNSKDDDKISKELKFIIEISNELNTITVKYETADITRGVKIQDYLNGLLINHYAKLVQRYKSEYEMQWNSIKDEIDRMKASVQSYKRNVKNIEKRNKELLSEVEFIRNNTTNLIMEKNKLSSINPKENVGLQILFYSYLVQQNIKLSNDYLNEINDYKLKKEEQLEKIQRLNNEIELKLNDINKLKIQKDNIQNIQILQSDTTNPYPIKPKTKLIFILALVTGLFLMLFLSFFLEYLIKCKKNKNNK